MFRVDLSNFLLVVGSIVRDGVWFRVPFLSKNKDVHSEDDKNANDF